MTTLFGKYKIPSETTKRLSQTQKKSLLTGSDTVAPFRKVRRSDSVTTKA